MKTTKRFQEATEKLYKAFNEGTLNAFHCTACAVGTLVDTNFWSMHGIIPSKNKIESFHNEPFFLPPEHKDYSTEELFNIEKIFLTKWQKENKLSSEYGQIKEIQFKGLISVINYLAELDGIETIDSQYEKFKSVLDRELEPINT